MSPEVSMGTTSLSEVGYARDKEPEEEREEQKQSPSPGQLLLCMSAGLIFLTWAMRQDARKRPHFLHTADRSSRALHMLVNQNYAPGVLCDCPVGPGLERREYRVRA